MFQGHRAPLHECVCAHS